VSAGFPWYERLEGTELQQGDFLDDCAAPIENDVAAQQQPSDQPITIDVWNVIVLTQSCDLGPKQVSRVMVCPVWDFAKWIEVYPAELRKDRKKKLQSDQLVAYHLLNPCGVDDLKRGHQVVEFGNAFSVTRAYAGKLAAAKSPRLRLLPPYREYLAQAFARYFMRVGLPVDRDPLP
jgi:hypothetical protein